MSVIVITLDPTPQDVQIEQPATSFGQAFHDWVIELPTSPPVGGGEWNNGGVVSVAEA